MIVNAFNIEFGYELISVIPYAYWLHTHKQLEGTISAMGSEALYYFSPNHTINPNPREWANMKDFRKSSLPNKWIHTPNLDISKFSIPPYKKIFANDEYKYDKPLVCICNRYNNEWGKPPINFFSLETLHHLFSKLKNKYQVIYWATDLPKELQDGVEPLNLGDYEYTKGNHPEVLIFQDLLGNKDWNTELLKIFSNCKKFITMNGGYSILASYFGGTNIIYSKQTQEIKPSVNSFYRWFHKLGNSRILHSYNYRDLYGWVEDVFIKETPVINILVRTSNRPNFFKECINSILNQTYKNINILVSYDDEETNAYITPYPVKPIKCFRVRADKIPEPPNRIEYGLNAPYNIYFNNMMTQVKEGYIIYQDDDDKFADKFVIEKIVNKIVDKNSLVLWKIQAPKRVVPSKENFGKEPVNCDIGGNAFLFHSDYKHLATWEPYRKGNWRVCSKLYPILNPIWINEILCESQIPVAGYGRRLDLPITEIPKPLILRPLDRRKKNLITTIKNPHTMNCKHEIINHLISKFGFKTYLEIGCAKNHNYSQIICEDKLGVDPVMGGTYRGTSDDFFKDPNFKGKNFDFIFIDGLHHEEQLLKDIKNSIKRLTPQGVILLHDMLPTNEAMQKVPREVRDWTGDVWKGFIKFRNANTTIFSCVIDTDFGLGFIRPSKKNTHTIKKIPVKFITYDNFVINKKEWMNILEVDTFLASL
jgi:hypothetical protein